MKQIQFSSLKVVAVAAVAGLFALQAQAEAKKCDELKTEITAKLDAKGVTGYTLDVVAADDKSDAKVVGTCDGGSKKITYSRGAAAAPTAPAAAASGAAAAKPAAPVAKPAASAAPAAPKAAASR
jgi:hypothetical protein